MTLNNVIRRASDLLLSQVRNSHRKICRKFYKSCTVQVDHIDRMSGSERDQTISMATVTETSMLSPTVKGITLLVKDDSVSFKPGQWVDLYIPELDKIGGYSMCSAPSKLDKHKLMDLAIKYSPYPPTLWCHEKCQVNTEVAVRVGGDFYYDPQPGDPVRDLLLIAGGVGINPLISMARHVADLKHNTAATKPGNVFLLYSATSENEFVFRDDIEALAEQDIIQCRLHLTKDEIKRKIHTSCPVYNTIITKETLHEIFQNNLKMDRTDCYLCGPPLMIDSMEKHLLELGLNESAIHYEKWW